MLRLSYLLAHWMIAPSNRRMVTRQSIVQDELVSDDEMQVRRVMHRALVRLGRRGVVYDLDLLEPTVRLVSEYSDPLATGADAFRRACGSLRLAVDSLPRYQNFTARQRFSVGPLRGTSLVTFSPATGRVAEHRLGDLTLGGVSLLGSRAAELARSLLISSVDYDALANLSQRAVLAISSRTPMLDDEDDQSALQSAAEPDAQALGTPAFEAFDRSRTAAKRLVNYLPMILEQRDEDAALFAPDVTVVGLSGEVLASSRSRALRLLSAARAARDALRPALGGETIHVRPTRFDAPLLEVEFAYSNALSKLKAVVSFRIGDKVEAVRLSQLVIDGRKVRPSAFAALLFGSNTPPRPATFRKVDDADAVASFRIAALLYDRLPTVLADSRSAEAFLDALDVADDIQVTGLLGERLLDGKGDVLRALTATSFFLNPYDIQLEKIEILAPQAHLKVTFRFKSANREQTLFTIACVLVIRRALLSAVTFLDFKGGRPVALANALKSARDAGADVFKLPRLVPPRTGDSIDDDDNLAAVQ